MILFNTYPKEPLLPLKPSGPIATQTRSDLTMPLGFFLGSCHEEQPRGINPSSVSILGSSEWEKTTKGVPERSLGLVSKITTKISLEVFLNKASRPVGGHGHLGQTFHGP